VVFISKAKQPENVKMDEILKQLFQVSNNVLVVMLNSLFGKDIDPEKTEVEISNNEFVTEELGLLRGDLFLTLTNSEKKNRFHIEFQTIQDRGMVIRMFEYGFHKARELVSLKEEETVIFIPEQIVIFVEEHESVRDELKMRLVFPEDQEMVYRVPVIKYWQFDCPELLQRKLYPLLPLQIFKLRRELERLKKQKDSGEKMLAGMVEVQKMAEMVAGEAKNLYDRSVIPGEDLHRILVAVESLFEYLNLKYAGITKLTEEVHQMVKTLFDPEVEKKGIEKGIEQGIEQGQLQAKRETVYKLMKKKLGSIPDHLLQQIEEADCLTLTRILDDIFDINCFGELESYFLPEG
jgi:hypothetical protein